jgi:thioredoxin-related protein
MMRLVMLLMIAVLAAPASAVELRDPGSHFFTESFGDMTEEIENAKDEEKKAILIMFEMDECPYCHRMKNTVLNRKDVQEFFTEHFLILSMDVEGDQEITDFNGESTVQKDFALKQFRVRATPVFQFIDLEGKPIKRARFTGATGTPEEFILLGQYVLEKQYEKMSFTKYKRQAAEKEKQG